MSVFKADSNILGRARHLTLDIYPKLLRITRDLDGTENITIDGFDPAQFPFSWSPRYSIVLSCALLVSMTMNGRISFSFTSFITTQELSGPFYISPDIYHTQITEYSLLTFYKWALLSESSSKIISIVFMLDLSNFLVSSNGTGALWITSPVLFQLKRFSIYSGNQFIQDPLCAIALRNWCLICWRLL